MQATFGRVDGSFHPDVRAKPARPDDGAASGALRFALEIEDR
jgi:hypothetical protein